MKNKPARVYLFGGLGNQIFQYYFGIFLSLTQKREVIFDESLVSVHGNNHGTRLSSLLNIKTTRTKPNLLNHILSLKFRILARVQRNLLKKPFLEFAKTFTSTEVGFVDIDFASSNANSYFGYFQSSRYFELAGGGEIFLDALRNSAIKYKDQFKNIKDSNSFGIHIRRGDYVGLSESYGILSTGYYVRALTKLGLNRNSVLYILSDDIDFAKTFLLNVLPEVKCFYIDDLEPLESLLLFSQCKRICISNSTFGYWAAMLGNPEAVTAPKKWFRNLPDPEGIIPENWYRIESEWEV